MKPIKIRLPIKRKSIAKKPIVARNKREKQENARFDVIPIITDSGAEHDSDNEIEPVPSIAIEQEKEELEHYSDNEIERVSSINVEQDKEEIQQYETVDGIQDFIRETNELLKDDEVYENTMPSNSSLTVTTDEGRKGKRQTVLEAKVDSLEKKLEILAYDMKDIKDLLKIRAKKSRNTGQILAHCKEACTFSLLPEFELRKVSHVEKMESDIHANVEYKEQLVHKMSLFGGRTIKEVVINIFRKMFTKRLTAKFCWTGSTKGKGKDAFQKFVGIISAIQIATSAHFDCTISEIEEECKLRLNQAPKDYVREKAKKKMQRERLERKRLALAMNQDSDDE